MTATTTLPLRPPTSRVPSPGTWGARRALTVLIVLTLAVAYVAVLLVAFRASAVAGMPSRMPGLVREVLADLPIPPGPCPKALADHVRATFAARVSDAFPTRARFGLREAATLDAYEALDCPAVPLMVGRTAALMAADEALGHR